MKYFFRRFAINKIIGVQAPAEEKQRQVMAYKDTPLNAVEDDNACLLQFRN
jgi:hypothetical protein